MSDSEEYPVAQSTMILEKSQTEMALKLLGEISNRIDSMEKLMTGIDLSLESSLEKQMTGICVSLESSLNSLKRHTDDIKCSLTSFEASAQNHRDDICALLDSVYNVEANLTALDASKQSHHNDICALLDDVYQVEVNESIRTEYGRICTESIHCPSIQTASAATAASDSMHLQTNDGGERGACRQSDSEMIGNILVGAVATLFGFLLARTI